MRLGIDFGTCFSSAAFMEGETRTIVKDPFFGDFSIPSSVFINAKGEVSIGRAANNQRLRDSQRYRNELKRDLGRDVPFLLGNRPYHIEELVASVIGKIKRDADAQVTNSGRRPFTGAVLTIPSTYQEHKRSLMLQAAAEAGFNREEVTLLEEPVAAAHYYAQQNTMLEGEILLVYDLGGGTFDTALLRKKGDEFEYLALPTGIERCGGIDFDRAIYNDVIRQHPELQDLLQGARDDRISLMARVTVGEMCINLKHQLSLMEEVEISFVVPGTGELIEHCLTQQSFNQMIASTIEETIVCCRSMIQSANIPYEQISRILLVGGSCRIPYVQQMLRQEFQRPISAAPDLELVVCQGAAFYATQHEVLVVSSTPGTADYTTISAALQQAKPKSLIVVCPGIYQESLVLDREIEIAGVGPQEDIIVTSPDAIGLKVASSSVLVRGITLRHTATDGRTWKEYGAVVVVQGDLTLADCTIDTGIHGVSIWGTESSATLRRCRILARKNANVAINNGGRGILQDCDLSYNADAGIHVRDKSSFVTVQQCRVHDGESLGISISSAGKATIEDCDIFGNASAGIQIRDEGSSATIRHCRIHDEGKMGITLWQKGQAFIEDCDIFDNLHAGILIVDEGSIANIQDCQIHDGKYVGVDVLKKGQASIKDSDIHHNADAGIRVRDEGSQATIQKCHIHDGMYTGILISSKGRGGILDCAILSNAGPGVRVCNANSQAAIDGCHIHDGNAVGIVIEDEGEGSIGSCTIEGNKLDIYIEPGSVVQLPASNKIPAASALLKHLLFYGKPDSSNIAIWRQMPEPEQPKLFFFNPEELTLIYTLTGHTAVVRCLAIGPDVQTLVSGGDDNTIKVWNLQTGQLLRTLTGHANQVYGVAINPDGQTLVSGSLDQTIKVWNLQTGQLLRTLTGHANQVRCVAITPDGQTLLSGSADNTIKVWNLQTGQLLRTLSGHTSYIWSVAITPDGQTLVSGSQDKTIKAWTLQTGQILHTLSGHTNVVYGVAISPNGQTLVSGSHDNTIKAWNLQAGQLLSTFSGHTSAVYGVAISPDGQTLASGSHDQTIKLWNMQTGQLLRTLTGHKNLVWCVAISLDGQILVSGSGDGTIKIWGKQ